MSSPRVPRAQSSLSGLRGRYPTARLTQYAIEIVDHGKRGDPGGDQVGIPDSGSPTPEHQKEGHEPRHQRQLEGIDRQLPVVLDDPGGDTVQLLPPLGEADVGGRDVEELGGAEPDGDLLVPNGPDPAEDRCSRFPNH